METADVGVTGDDLYSAVTEKLKSAGLNSALNPGHLGSHEEWLHSPVRPGSIERLRSGMPFQVDVIPVPMPAGWALNCEDMVAFADARSARRYANAILICMCALPRGVVS